MFNQRKTKKNLDNINLIINSNFSINLDAIAALEARRQQIEAKYHDIYQPDDTRSEFNLKSESNASSNCKALLLEMTRSIMAY